MEAQNIHSRQNAVTDLATTLVFNSARKGVNSLRGRIDQQDVPCLLRGIHNVTPRAILRSTSTTAAYTGDTSSPQHSHGKVRQFIDAQRKFLQTCVYGAGTLCWGALKEQAENEHTALATISPPVI